jgi:hypothetical protein
MGSFKTFWREKKSKSDKSKVVSKRFGRWAALVYVTAPRLLRPKVDSALSASPERVHPIRIDAVHMSVYSVSCRLAVVTRSPFFGRFRRQ